MKRSQDNPVKVFTLIEILVILGILLVMAVILLPMLARQKARSSRIGCNNNLAQIQKAFRQWAMDYGDKYPMQVSVTNGGTMELVNRGTVFVHFLVMSNELSTPKLLMCPEVEDSSRKLATTFDQTAPAAPQFQVPLTNDHSLSYFVGVDADSSNPAMLLSGDANLALDGRAAGHGLYSFLATNMVTWRAPRHEKGGYVCMVDGSVQTILNRDWPRLLVKTGQQTNRLALP